MSDQIGKLVDQVNGLSFQSLAKLLTLLEREGPSILAKNPSLLKPPHPAFRVGITGPPGAGKSTLVGALLKEFLNQNLRVAVLAVDPSSPFSKGAILGDRIRYSELSTHPNVFIRSVGSRGGLGGLCADAYLLLRGLECFPFDLILIETVGVGQTEFEIMHVADLVSVVLVPESGDSIQAMKAGLLEVADQFVVNKSDRPGADGLLNELRAIQEMGDKSVDYFKTIGTQGAGVSMWSENLLKRRENFKPLKQRGKPEQLRWEAKALLRWSQEASLTTQVSRIKTLSEFSRLFTKKSKRASSPRSKK